jgi:copper transport protein
MRALLRSRFGIIVLLTIGFSTAMVNPASAHNEIVSSSIVDGAVLAVSPAQWELTFAKDVPLDSASGEIVGPDGSITQLGTPSYGANATIIRFALPANLSGAHTTRWRLVSVDGHVISGRNTFTVGNVVVDPTTAVLGAGETADTADSTNPAPEPLRWAIRLLGFLALLGLGGFLVNELYIVEGVFGASRDKPILKIIAGALVAVPLLQMLIFLGDVFGTSIFGSVGHLIDIFDTTPGSMFAVRTLLGGVLAYQLLTVMRGEPTVRDQRLVLAASGLYALTQAYTGHSRSKSIPLIGIPADAVHLVAASVWLGGLAILIFFAAPLLETKDLWRSFERYSQAAKVAVIALVVTGVIQTLRLHGGITTLFTQSHGQLLLLKILVVAVMLRLGDLNRRRITARMKDNPNLMDKRLTQITKMATTEVATGGVVLAVTAALVTASFS